MGSTPKGVPRPFLDSARWQHETGPWGTQPPHHQTGNADTEPGAPLSRPQLPAHQVSAINPAHLTNHTTYQGTLAPPVGLAAGADDSDSVGLLVSADAFSFAGSVGAAPPAALVGLEDPELEDDSLPVPAAASLDELSLLLLVFVVLVVEVDVV